MVYRYERNDNEIKNGAQLVVRESQAAVFVNEGELADVFPPGKYELKTENLPVLSKLKGWKYGFESPFKAMNTLQGAYDIWSSRDKAKIKSDKIAKLEAELNTLVK